MLYTTLNTISQSFLMLSPFTNFPSFFNIANFTNFFDFADFPNFSNFLDFPNFSNFPNFPNFSNFPNFLNFLAVLLLPSCLLYHLLLLLIH